jgi:GWxTD domain-containing protein
MALARLMRKQQMNFDARRVLNRARKAARESPDDIRPSELAQLWYELGLFAEDIYLDTRNLVLVRDLPVQTPDCANLGAFCLNFTRPKQFNDYFRTATSLSDYAEDDYAEMIDAFRRALDADPGHAGAFRRLAVHLVERGAYGEARRLAQRFQSEAPENPWGYMTLGLIYQRTGLDSLAQLEFDRGIALAGPDIAEHYRDISYVLREDQAEEYGQASTESRRWVEDLLWRKSDPLYLTPGNEVRVAHLARVTFADLWFEDPSEGRWGADSERGRIYVRYGPPKRVWQVQRDVSREMGADGFETRQSSARGGGRWIFWNYAWDLPNFIFAKQLSYRHASHLISSISKSLEEDAREMTPAIYSTNFKLLDYPVQIARFRGAVDTIVEVDFYSEAPADSLLERPDTLDFGLFLFAGDAYTEVLRRVLQAPMKPKPQALTYSLPLTPGRYSFSLEARSRSLRAAVRRGEVDAQPFRDSVLALSDLVLADAVTPKAGEHRDRRDFTLKVNRRRVFDRDFPVAVYWEVYGLATDESGFANYQVQISVTDARGKGVVAKLARVFGLGEDEQIELSYERIVEFDGERVPEYMSIELPDSDPGEYRLTITVKDIIKGTSITGERTFQLIAAE